MMLRCRVSVVTLTVMTFFMMSALQVHAEETKGTRITVTGLVVSFGHEVTLTDGDRDYLLLGVDALQYEGATCEVSGMMELIDDVPTITVETIVRIAKDFPDEDLVGQGWGFGSPISKLYRQGIHANAPVPLSVAMLSSYDLNLPIWEGSGMGMQKGADVTFRHACRFLLFTPIRTA